NDPDLKATELITVTALPLVISPPATDPIFSFLTLSPPVVLATFSDPNAVRADTSYSAQVDWGDGSSSSVVPSANGDDSWRVMGQHSYAQPGFHSIQVTIKGSYGIQGSTTAFGSVLSYDTSPNSISLLAGYVEPNSNLLNWFAPIRGPA